MGGEEGLGVTTDTGWELCRRSPGGVPRDGQRAQGLWRVDEQCSQA